MDKTNPETTVDNTLRGLENDDASQQVFDAWMGGYGDLEQMVSSMHHTA